MRGHAFVLTLAFVFASSLLLVGPASAQTSDPSEPTSSPPYPGQEYRPEPTDATLQGRVTDQNGDPVAGAQVSSWNYGPIYYSEPAEGDDGSSSGSGEAKRSPYYGGNSTVTDADGRFSLGVYSGENQVSVYRDGYASRSVSVPISPGQTASQDVELQKFPEKTARIEGRVTDARTGKGLQHVSISVNSPWYGVYACSSPAGSADGGGSGGSTGTIEPMPAERSMVAPDSYPYPGCDITVHPDGRFEGSVTPGYAIVTVYYDSWRACYESQGPDATYNAACAPQYFSFARTLTLAGNGTTVLDVELRPHPSPNAVVSGYLIDAESGQAIPDATISFNNEESYGYGHATTDGDGSYKLRLRSGHHSVSVWAPGHLPWQGILQVAAGESSFDVELVPGEPAYGGGCCWAYAEKGGVAMAEDSAGAPMPASATTMSTGASRNGLDPAAGDGDSEAIYEDLGGGLGPYNAAERQSRLEDSPENGVPGLGLFATLAVVGLVALALRRRIA